MSLVDRSAEARGAGPTPEELAAIGRAVREYVQGVTAYNIELCKENAQLKKRVSNQRRELRRLVRAQRLIKLGIQLGVFSQTNAVRQSEGSDE